MRRISTAIALVVASGTCATATGCLGTAIRREEVPEQPIAFVYYDVPTARRRAERVTDQMKAEGGRNRRGTDPRVNEIVAPVGEIGEYLQQTFDVEDRRSPENLQGRLALLDPRTGEVSVVEGPRRGAVPLDWSQDHQRLLFSQVVRDEIPHLFELDVASGEIRSLTRGRLAHPEGCYGPDGRIVFTAVDTRQDRKNARIMITDPHGDEPLQLSGPGYAYYPACAPDGSAVVYTVLAASGRAPRVVVRSPVLSGEPRVLTPGKEPAFSADGQWIAFSAQVKKEWVIWRIRPDGSGRGSLGRSGFDEQRPGLSPDGRLVVYVADTKINQRLYLRRVDGSGDRILLSDGDGDRPVW